MEILAWFLAWYAIGFYFCIRMTLDYDEKDVMGKDITIFTFFALAGGFMILIYTFSMFSKTYKDKAIIKRKQ